MGWNEALSLVPGYGEWDKMEKRADETYLEFTERKICAMAKWHANNRSTLISMGDEFRSGRIA